MKSIELEKVYDNDGRYLGKVIVYEDGLNAMKGVIKADKTDKLGYRKYKDQVNKHFKEKVI